MKKVIVYTLTLFIVIVISCEKDDRILVYTCDNPPPSDTCIDFPVSLHEWGPNPGYMGYSINPTSLNNGHPDCNPNNPSEIVYGQGVSPYWRFEIWIMNITSGEKYLVSNEVPDIWDGPRWSSTNWLVFSRSDGQIWKMTIYGDSLTKLTSSGQNFNPCWSPDGEKIIFESISDSNYIKPEIQEYRWDFFIMTADGKDLIIMDPLLDGALPVWSPDGNKIAFAQKYNSAKYYPDIGFTDISNISSSQITWDNMSIVLGLNWFPDSKNVVWSSEQGLFITNIETKKTTLVAPGCDSKTYLYPSISSDGSKILFEKLDACLVNNYEIFLEHRIWSMNVDGSGMVQLTF